MYLSPGRRHPYLHHCVYPVSTTDCQRGFGAMNLKHELTGNVKINFKTETFNSLLAFDVGLNGSPVYLWRCGSCVRSWLRKGRRGAKDRTKLLCKISTHSLTSN